MATESVPTTQPEYSQGRVAKNASIYLFAQIFGWLSNIIVLSTIPRTLGESAMGRLAYVTGIGTMICLCVMLGGETYLTVEIGRDRSAAARLIGAMLGLRLALSPIFIGANLLFFALARDIDSEMWRIVYLCSVAGILTLLNDPLRAVMVASEDAKRVSMLDLFFTLSPLLTLPFLRYGIITQSICLLLTSLLVFSLRCRMVSRFFSLRPRFEPLLWKRILIGGIPYQANILILQVYGLLSALLIKHFANYETLGVYSQAQRLFSAFLFVPNALGMALLPSLARMAEASEDEFRQTQSRVLVLLIVIALPVTTAVFFMSDAISLFLYGPTKYVDMPLVLKVYAFAVAPIYIVSTMYQFLVAQKRGAIWTGFLILSVVLFAVFAALLIPYTLRVYHSGATGAVAATFLAELCSACFALVLLGNNPLHGQALRRITRTLFATGGMAAALWLTRSLFPLVSLALGLIVFVLLAWYLHVLTPDEQQRVAALAQRLRRRRT